MSRLLQLFWFGSARAGRPSSRRSGATRTACSSSAGWVRRGWNSATRAAGRSAAGAPHRAGWTSAPRTSRPLRKLLLWRVSAWPPRRPLGAPVSPLAGLWVIDPLPCPILV